MISYIVYRQARGRMALHCIIFHHGIVHGQEFLDMHVLYSHYFRITRASRAAYNTSLRIFSRAHAIIDDISKIAAALVYLSCFSFIHILLRYRPFNKKLKKARYIYRGLKRAGIIQVCRSGFMPINDNNVGLHVSCIFVFNSYSRPYRSHHRHRLFPFIRRFVCLSLLSLHTAAITTATFVWRWKIFHHISLAIRAARLFT